MLPLIYRLLCKYLSNELDIHHVLTDFVKNELLVGLDISPEQFWNDFEHLLSVTVNTNQELINKRLKFKKQIDTYTLKHKSEISSGDFTDKFIDYLKEIGYLVDEPKDFKVTTNKVDSEVSEICAPQLVVPVNNARYALNAVNARWGSLFNSLYFTDVIPFHGKKPSLSEFDEKRAINTITWMDKFLDTTIPLTRGVQHSDVTGYSVDKDGKLNITSTFGDVSIVDINAFVGYNNSNHSILFKHNDLHVELITDTTKSSPVGKVHHAMLKDIVLESAVSIILDCEDSVSAVDTQDKTLVYRNWLGINKGNLECKFKKGDLEITRTLNEDKIWYKDDDTIQISGRALTFVRNVGIHMYTDSVKYNGRPIPEGILDAYITIVAGIHDLNKDKSSKLRNSKQQSIYIVKPKMHGPEEVEFVCNLLSKIEDIFNLSRNTVKLGIMDEERRTTINLKECIRIAKERVVFINTGFLDRVGDEISTIMESGPVLPKGDIKRQKWLQSYENWNVDVGLETGLPGHALIGKGMWAAPDSMSDMIHEKTNHLKQGASCAWVPSPTAATLHATHYHCIYVKDVQKALVSRKRDDIRVLVTPEPWDFSSVSKELIYTELEDNIQGLLGYVVRWINHGIGCSKVPNINNIGLMEDRATLRISSQLIANWIHHGVVTKNDVEVCLLKMTKVVDLQNCSDNSYIGYNNQNKPVQTTIAFKAAQELIFNGVTELNGYTEQVLHNRRVEFKK